MFNGIWQVGRGFQVSGLFYLGIGERAATVYGGDLRGFGAAPAARRCGASGCGRTARSSPRNDFTQPARRRVDLRLQQRIPLGGRASIDGIAEVFNVFNSPNWTITTDESSRSSDSESPGRTARRSSGSG